MRLLRTLQNSAEHFIDHTNRYSYRPQGHSVSQEKEMLNNGAVTANIPAANLKRARAFYADRLGLTPSYELKKRRY
jgi:hypothetical protein